MPKSNSFVRKFRTLCGFLWLENSADRNIHWHVSGRKGVH